MGPSGLWDDPSVYGAFPGRVTGRTCRRFQGDGRLFHGNGLDRSGEMRLSAARCSILYIVAKAEASPAGSDRGTVIDPVGKDPPPNQSGGLRYPDTARSSCRQCVADPRAQPPQL